MTDDGVRGPGGADPGAPQGSASPTGYPGPPPTGYPGGPGYGYWTPHQPGTNGLAIASLVLGIVWVYWIGSVLAVIFGHVALRQIRRSGQGGRGLAIAGLVLGYVGIAVLVLAVVGIAALGLHGHSGGSTPVPGQNV